MRIKPVTFNLIQVACTSTFWFKLAAIGCLTSAAMSAIQVSTRMTGVMKASRWLRAWEGAVVPSSRQRLA